MSAKDPAAVKRDQDAAKKILRDGKDLPLDIMVDNMRTAATRAAKYEKLAEEIDVDRIRGKKKKADALAKKLWYETMGTKYRALAQAAATDSAPFLHAKIQAISMKHTGNIPTVLRFVGADAKA